MPSSRGGLSRPRRTTPQSPQKPQSQLGVTQPTRRATRSASREPEPDAKQQQVSALEAVIEEQVQDGLDLEDPSLAYSQLTGLSLETQNELAKVDPDLIVEALPGLYDDAVKVIDLFQGLDEGDLSIIYNEAHDAGEPTAKRIGFRMNRLVDSLKPFGATRILINPEIIIRKLRGNHNVNDDGRWRPDAVLYLANVALLLGTLVGGLGTQPADLLDQAYVLFPILFVPASPMSRFSTASMRQSIELANLLRTHFFIHCTRRDMNSPSYDPDDALKDIFYYDGQLRGLECTGAESSFYIRLIEDHLRHIRTFFSEDANASVRLADLEGAFPWSTFMHQALLWATARREELGDSIVQQGGVEDVVASLQEADAVNAFTNANAELAQSSVASNRPSGKTLRDNLARKKELDASRAREMEEASFVSQDPSVQGEIAESIVQDNIGTFAMDDEELGSVLVAELQGDPERSQQLMQEGLAHLARKANNQMSAAHPPPPPPPRFLDRQEGAQRLTFDEASQAGPSRKRGPVPESDDGEFQTDSRAQSKRRRVDDHNIDPALRGNALSEWDMDEPTSPQPTLPPASAPRPRGGRPRTTGVAAAQPTSSAPAATGNTEASELSDLGQVGALPAPTAGDGELESAELLRKVQEKAKAITRQRKSNVLTQLPSGSPDPTQNTPPASQAITYQERKAWTPAEEQRLFDLIGIHGPAYSKILKDDKDDPIPLLQSRSQVQLKDKARNIKMSFYKSGTPLQPGFGAVSIGKKQVEKLQALGILIEVRFTLLVFERSANTP